MNANYRLELKQELRRLPLLMLAQIYFYLQFAKLKNSLKGK